MPNLGRGRSVADAGKDARVRRERRGAPNPITYQAPARAFRSCHPISIHRVAEARERLIEEERVSGPSVHRGAHDQRHSGARVLRPRPACRPDGEDTRSFHGAVLNAVFAPRAVRGQPTTKISCSSKLTRPLSGAAHCRDLPPITLFNFRLFRGFRTTAPVLVDRLVIGPSSETRYMGRHCDRWKRTAPVGRACVRTLKSQQGGELFSLLSFFRSRATALFVFRLTKSRRTFYAKIERLCLRTASVELPRSGARA